MRLTCTCRTSSPHELAADVKVFGEEQAREPFITLDLTIGGDVIHVFLPPHAYHRARNIADLWEALVDPAPARMPVSPATGAIPSRPPRCEDCLVHVSDAPSKLCPGCQAYQEHQQ